MKSSLPAEFACLRQCFLLLTLAAALFALPPRVAADEPGVVDRTKAAANEAKVAVEDAGRAVADQAEEIWRRVSGARLKHRTPDQIVAWVIIGMLVGALAGLFTSLGTTAVGNLGRLLLGLAGAFLGGIVVAVGRFDFGMGPVLIRYEELLFAFVGAVILVGAGRLLGSKAKRKGA